jgi:hypothetical protein
MTATTQHGPHPPGAHLDAELLSAFAERALSAHERNHVLAHLAVCTRCRQVVALAAHTGEFEPQTLAATSGSAIAARRRAPNPWWTRWRLVWIPAAVVAAFTVTIVSIDLHRTEQRGVTVEIAQQAAPSAGPSAAPSPANPANATPPAAQAAPAAPPASSAPTEPRTPTSQPSAKSQPHFPSAAIRAASPELRTAPPALHATSSGAAAAPRALLSEQAPPPQPPPAVTETVTVASDQSAPETASAQQFISLQPSLKAANSPLRAAPPPPAGSAASPQLQAEREKKFSDFNRQVETTESSDHLSAARANPQSAPVAAAVSGANTSGVHTQAASNHGSLASFSSAFGLSSSAGLAGTPIHLPSGLALASIASSGHLLLAVDKAGALFLTQDSAITWRQVAPQWSGRAVLVRTRNLADRREITPSAAASESEPASDSPAPSASSVVFEVVNEKNQVWQSDDGLVWTAK